VQRLEEFLQALPPKHRYAFEFREPSWNTPAVYDVLRRYNAAYCIHELAGFHTDLVLTADFTYVRLHGPGGKYQGCYADEKLRKWAERIAGWSRKLKGIYLYFDNDDSGYAPRNALELKHLVKKLRPGVSGRAA
jgi:uncharacterized protein YecE (DUF72 family)